MEPTRKWRYHPQTPIFIKINLSNVFIRVKFAVPKAELPCFSKFNTLFASLSSMSHARNHTLPLLVEAGFEFFCDYGANKILRKRK
jgi:hypothetical protein